MSKEFEYPVVGVDIGGSHITAGLIDGQCKSINGRVIRKRIDSNGNADEIIESWIAVIKQVWSLHRLESCRIGFAMPGAFDYENGICLIRGFNKYESLFGMSIRNLLSDGLGLDRSHIQFRNDAEAFLAGEIHAGAAIGYQHIIGITLGTGLGSAVSHYGETYDAELSMTSYKGQIIEEYVSTRGIIEAYNRYSGGLVTEVKEVADLAMAGDHNAQNVIDDFGDNLSWFLDMFIRQEKPELVVVGGNIANAWDMFMPNVIRSLERDANVPKVVKATLGEDALLIGGALCFHGKQASLNL